MFDLFRRHLFPDRPIVKYFLRSRVLLFTNVLLISCMMISCVVPAQGAMEKMSTQELREVAGRNLLDFVIENGSTNVTPSVGDLAGAFSSSELNIDTTEWTYTRLELNAIITGEFIDGENPAEIENLKLGHYDDSGNDQNGSSSDVTHHDADGFCNDSTGQCDGVGTSFHNPSGGSGWDLRMDDLYIGRDGPNQNFDQPAMKGPYVEMVWDNMQNADPSDNKLMGIRIGLQGLQGGFTLNLPQSAASGFFAGQDFNDAAGLNCAMHRGNGPVGDGCGNISLFGAAEAGCGSSDSNCSDKGDNDPWTEDFWLSFNKRDVFYEFANPVLESNNEPDQNQAWAKSIDAEGFWVHATDDIEGGLD